MSNRNRRTKQPRIPGMRRKQMSAAMNDRIEAAIRREQNRYKGYVISRSFVIAVAIAHALNVKLSDEEEY